MKTCKTCRYREPSHRRHREENGKFDIGTCNHPKMKQGYGKTVNAPDEVVIEDDEDWGIEMGPDFGCIHHTNKIPATVQAEEV